MRLTSEGWRSPERNVFTFMFLSSRSPDAVHDGRTKSSHWNESNLDVFFYRTKVISSPRLRLKEFSQV